jgi:methyl-accepting chemotaxis protein
VIQVVRTPTAEVDRRQRRRHAVNQTGRLAVAGQGDHTARVTDLSEGGALVSGVPDMRMGRTVHYTVSDRSRRRIGLRRALDR